MLQPASSLQSSCLNIFRALVLAAVRLRFFVRPLVGATRATVGEGTCRKTWSRSRNGCQAAWSFPCTGQEESRFRSTEWSSQVVACRGGRTGHRSRASMARGASKEWNYKNLNAVTRWFFCSRSTDTCCMDLILRNLFCCQYLIFTYSNASNSQLFQYHGPIQTDVMWLALDCAIKRKSQKRIER